MAVQYDIWRRTIGGWAAFKGVAAAHGTINLLIDARNLALESLWTDDRIMDFPTRPGVR
jgi:hypothetical protein